MSPNVSYFFVITIFLNVNVDNSFDAYKLMMILSQPRIQESDSVNTGKWFPIQLVLLLDGKKYQNCGDF